MPDVDVAAIKKAHTVEAWTDDGWGWCVACQRFGQRPGCETYQLAVALERAQAASEGLDMLIAAAERRGAVKALESIRSRVMNHKAFLTEGPLIGRLKVEAWLNDAIEIGADL